MLWCGVDSDESISDSSDSDSESSSSSDRSTNSNLSSKTIEEDKEYWYKEVESKQRRYIIANNKAFIINKRYDINEFTKHTNRKKILNISHNTLWINSTKMSLERLVTNVEHHMLRRTILDNIEIELPSWGNDQHQKIMKYFDKNPANKTLHSLNLNEFNRKAYNLSEWRPGEA